MTKTRTARLSLTMPGSADGQSNSTKVSDTETRASSRSGAPTGLRRPEGRSGEKKSTTEVYEQEPISSRSISPSAAPFSAASEQSRSPTSPTSPAFTSLPPYPPSPELNTKHSREQSKSFFQNLKAATSSAKIQPPESTIRHVPTDNNVEEGPRAVVKTKSTPDLRGESQPEPVPDLPRLDRDEASQQSVSSSTSSHTIPRRPVGTSSGSSRSNFTTLESTPQSPIMEGHEGRKNAGKLFPSFMKRNHSNKPEDHTHGPKPGTPVFSKSPEPPIKPPSRDHSASRNTDDTEGSMPPYERHGSASRTQLKDQRSQSFRDGPGSNLFKGFRSHAGRAAKDIGKAGKGLFRQRHTSNSQPPPDPISYQCKVINMPLIDQTRITRIAKRLEDSKDKTEFWMPALPWRCIDFLNYTGCETEGLYRVPGSEREVKLWRAKFDQEHDINLFEEEELYDINIIGSLFKSWLRDLPDEIFPQSLQEDLSRKHPNQPKAPEELKEVLSRLPPWNYYLLFAITCHLSLLHAYSDKNKMTFHNLFICFATSLKINGDCFRWLVGDWRSCWKGCSTEKDALEAEYRILDGDPFESDDSSEITKINDRQNSSSGSAEPTPKAGTFQTSARPMQVPKPLRTRNESPSAVHVPGLRSGSNTSLHSRDSSRHTSSRDTASRDGVDQPCPGDRPDRADKRPMFLSAHQRSQSQLPDLDFGKPISPTFANHQ